MILIKNKSYILKLNIALFLKGIHKRKLIYPVKKRIVTIHVKSKSLILTDFIVCYNV